MPTADELLGSGEIDALARGLARAAGRPLPAVASSHADFDGQPLRQRVAVVRDALLTDTGGDFSALEALILAGLPGEALRGWRTWPVSEAVAVSALADPASDAFERGLALLRALTPRLTSEWALRPFLRADLDRTLAVVHAWAADPDPHVRRLASEGTRLRLPWGTSVPQLSERPSVTLPVIEALHTDPDEVVRRSVANHLNDLSRLAPRLVVDTCARWLAGPAPTTPGLVRHALRTLIKAGDPESLALLGFGAVDALTIDGPHLAVTRLREGDELGFSFSVTNDGDRSARLAIDYVVHYRKASGGLAPKVFKLATCTLKPGEVVTYARARSFKPITTRRHHPGGHALELQINGQRFGRREFELLASQ